MDDRTATMTMPGIRRKIRPDVRSDIYSTGATLYHLLSGRRPAKDALEVAPLSEMEVSPQIARMIAKAMAPNPQDRYQTASEMLWDLEHLRENDIRTIRHKRRVKTTVAALAVMFLLGGLLTFTGLKQMERAQAAGKAAAEMAEQALSAVSGSESAYRNGDIPGAIRLAMDALTLESSPYEAPAQKALTDALGVYDLSDGFRPARTLPLPSAPLKHGQRREACGTACGGVGAVGSRVRGRGPDSVRGRGRFAGLRPCGWTGTLERKGGYGDSSVRGRFHSGGGLQG